MTEGLLYVPWSSGHRGDETAKQVVYGLGNFEHDTVAAGMSQLTVKCHVMLHKLDLITRFDSFILPGDNFVQFVDIFLACPGHS